MSHSLQPKLSVMQDYNKFLRNPEN
jgi:hypothetical protein